MSEFDHATRHAREARTIQLRLAIVAMIVGGALVVGVIHFLMFFRGIHYSDGERSGYVVKLSKTGVWWETWEGQLLQAAPTGSPNTGAVVWEFSVTADHIAKHLSEAQAKGERVRLHYVEFLLRGKTLGRTHYDITDVAPEAK